MPMTDWMFLKELIRKYGWQAETREQLLDLKQHKQTKMLKLTEFKKLLDN